jgi:hypothetical protein
VLPDAISSSIAGVTRPTTWASDRPRSAGTHHLALAHRDAADHLRQEFAEPDTHQKLFQFAEPAGRAHALRKRSKLPDRLHIGRKPRQPVRGALLAVEQVARDAPVLAHPLSHRARRIREQRFDGGGRVARVPDQVRSGFGRRGECHGQPSVGRNTPVLALQHSLCASHKRRALSEAVPLCTPCRNVKAKKGRAGPFNR